MQTFTAVEWTKIDQGQTHPILLIYEWNDDEIFILMNVISLKNLQASKK